LSLHVKATAKDGYYPSTSAMSPNPEKQILPLRYTQGQDDNVNRMAQWPL